MNSFGDKFRVSIFGESHGEAIGAVIDGVPAGMILCENDLWPDLLRRKSGALGTTPRVEDDMPKFLSGVYQGHTTGAPLTIVFENKTQRSSDYSQFRDIPRPGHADYTASVKFGGCNDIRGGGHFSGRITLPVVAAGVIAKKITGFCYQAVIQEIGGETDKAKWEELLQRTIRERDSIGGLVACSISGVPAGLGEPFFNSVESLMAQAMFSIPGVRGVEFGDGFEAARMKGSEHNDPFISRDGQGLIPEKNGAGGINGGITNGAPILFRVAFKPTASISRPQLSYSFSAGEKVEFETKGRHDACFALRTAVIVEAMAAIVLANLL